VVIVVSDGRRTESEGGAVLEVSEVQLLEKSAVKLLEENEVDGNNSIYPTYSACSRLTAWKDKVGRLKK
jgi:hypothetical protein